MSTSCHVSSDDVTELCEPVGGVGWGGVHTFIIVNIWQTF